MTVGVRPDVPEVSLDDAQRAALLVALVAACGGDGRAVATDAESLEEASRDKSTNAPHLPLAVVTPATAHHAAAVLLCCADARVAVVPRGGGTGIEGAAIPYGGGVVVSTARMRRMQLNEGEMMAMVGAGIYKDELNKFLAPRSLLFGPDPSSNPTIGGMASTGGSGLSTLRYGTTKENVVSLVVATPQGKVIRTRRDVRKSSSGYELTQIYMGSEGTLGLICELTVRVHRLPPLRSGGIIPFRDLKSAVDSVTAAVRADPSTLLRCELLNDDGVKATNALFGTQLQQLPTLFLELRGKDPQELRRDFDVVAGIAAEHGAIAEKIAYAVNGEELDAIWEARRGCLYAAQKYRGIAGESVLITDVCVPISRLAACVAESEVDARAHGLEVVICAHIADGNFHCLIPHQPHEAASVRAFEERIIQRALDADGTVSGEHGVGVGKVAFMCREHGPDHVAVQRRIKQALDPLGIMNPGKVLPLDSDAAKL